MDSETLKDLESSPFGRKLKLLVHRLPRQWKGESAWELEQGFSCQLVTPDFFLLRLSDQPQASLPFLNGEDSKAGTDILIWQCPGKYDPKLFPSFCQAIQERPTIQAGLILSHCDEYSRALGDYLSHRQLWKTAQVPILQVFQNFPQASFFTVEKNLFALGRVGRRLAKLKRLRPWLPW